MSVETDLKAHLLADAAVAGLIGARLYPDLLPQGVQFPAASWQLVSLIEARDLTGAAGKERARIQISAWARTRIEAIAIGAAIKARMAPLRTGGQIGATRVHSVRLENVTDLFEEEPDLKGVYGRLQDWIVAHTNL